MTTEPTDSAFSHSGITTEKGRWEVRPEIGLTKREYFAAMRKEPIFGEETLVVSWAETIMGSKVPPILTFEYIQWWVEAHEKFSVIRADALIKALNKQP